MGFIRALLIQLRDRRRLAGIISVFIHAALAVVLLIYWSRPPIPRSKSALKVFTVAGLTDDVSIAHQARVAKSLTTRATNPLASSIPSTVTADLGTARGSTCGIAAAVQAGILDDPAALEELAALPRASLSVANAIALWSGPPRSREPALTTLAVDVFTPSAQSIQAPTQLYQQLPILDAAIVAELAGQTAECLDADQIGPAFLYLSHDDTSFSIAIGSGRWRWRNIAADLTLITNSPP